MKTRPRGAEGLARPPLAGGGGAARPVPPRRAATPRPAAGAASAHAQSGGGLGRGPALPPAGAALGRDGPGWAARQRRKAVEVGVWSPRRRGALCGQPKVRSRGGGGKAEALRLRVAARVFPLVAFASCPTAC